MLDLGDDVCSIAADAGPDSPVVPHSGPEMVLELGDASPRDDVIVLDSFSRGGGTTPSPANASLGNSRHGLSDSPSVLPHGGASMEVDDIVLDDGDGAITTTIGRSPSHSASCRVASSSFVLVPSELTLVELCCGWMSATQACVQKGIPHSVLLASDIDPSVRAFVRANFPVACWVDDVHSTQFQSCSPGALGVVAGFPCQPYSTEGQSRGELDERSDVIGPIIELLGRDPPVFFILENVLGLLSRRHSDFWNRVKRRLHDRTSGRYSTYERVLDSRDYSLPQARRRVYLVGIRTDLMQSPFAWPIPSSRRLVEHILDEAGSVASVERVLTSHTARANLAKARQQVAAVGGDISRHHYIVDIGAGRARANVMLDCVPTITKNRGSARDYYDTLLGRRLSLTELMRCQGAEPSLLKFGSAVLSARAMGGIVGNAMSVSVVAALLEQILKSLGWSSLLGTQS